MIAQLVCRGFGPSASIALLVTAGYSIGAAAVVIPETVWPGAQAPAVWCVLPGTVSPVMRLLRQGLPSVQREAPFVLAAVRLRGPS